MNKHTPGPWSFSTPVAINDSQEAFSLISIYSDNGTHICDKKILTSHLPEHRANAKLICASPEMLELLRKSSKLLEQKGYSMFAAQINKLIDPII